ncbi:MAG: cyanophycin synthetase [Clostridia bacterium]|nr:cyanophycin synthetase [Clostridia bacterium]
MKIERIDVFEGPNVYCLRPTVRMLLDLEGLDGVETRAVPGFDRALLTVLPGLRDHHCSRGRPGGFVERLVVGTWFGHVVEHVALELLWQAGQDVRYGRTRRHKGSVFAVVFEHAEPRAGRAAAVHAVGLVEDLLRGDEEGARARLGEVAAVVEGTRLGPSTQAIWDEARRRGIPVRRAGDGNLIELGYGVHRRRLWATLTDHTSAVAVDLAEDKVETKRILAEAGLPVPDGVAVRDEEAAVRAFFALGGKVVVKPARGNQGRGVSAGLGNEHEVRRAFRLAEAEARPGEPVLVERQVPGRSFRVLVVAGEAVAAAERVPPSVVGDGRRTVRELVRETNSDPRRGEGHGRPLTRVPLDAIALACLERQGLGPDDVPACGRTVWLRDSANLSTGGTARDATDELHPQVARAAERAARAIGLDLAGVDLVAPAVSRPLEETGGAVIEVNASPGLRMHLHPERGRPRPVAARILDALYGGSSARIPIVAVTGTNGKTTVARLVAHGLRRSGRVVGLAATGGVEVAGERLAVGDTTGPQSARLVLSDPRVEAAVLETARGGILRAGLGFDACDVAVVTNVAADHLGQDGVETLTDLVWVKSLLADVVRPGGSLVLNAQDPSARAIARGRSVRLVWFGGSPERERPDPAGEAWVYAAEGALWLEGGGRRERLLPVARLGFAGAGRPAYQLENAACAAAALLSLGVGLREVGEALASFGERDNLGRFQVFAARGATVVVDYGHNPPAWEATLPAARRLASGALWGVIGVPGDRRDDLVRAAGAAAARWCTRLVIKEDADRRGRRPGEVARLLLEGAVAAGFEPGRAEIVLDEREAVRRALTLAAPGDVVVVFYESFERVVREVEQAASAWERAVGGLAAT